MRLVVHVTLAIWMLHPVGVPAMQPPESEPMRRAQTVLASALDASLPPISLDRWIRQVVGPSARYEWADGACAGLRGSVDAPVRLCGIVMAATPDAAVTVSVHVGERGVNGDADRWQTPRLGDVFIDRGNESLSLDRLSDLPRFLSVPPQDWPKRAVSLEKEDVRCSPQNPLAHEEVTCAVAISNPGETPIHARVFVEVYPYPERGSEFAVKLPGRSRRSLKVFVEWPGEETATVSIGVELNHRSPYRRLDENGQLN